MSNQIDRPFAARVLVQAFHSSVAAAAAANGVEARRVYRWRDRLPKDPELRRLYADALGSSDGEWRRELRIVAAESCKAIVSMQRDMLAALSDAREVDGDPMQRAVMLAESQAMALRVMQASVETLVQYEALVDVVGGDKPPLKLAER